MPQETREPESRPVGTSPAPREFLTGLVSALLLTLLWFLLLTLGPDTTNDEASVLLLGGAAAILLAGVVVLLGSSRRALGLGLVVGGPLGVVIEVAVVTVSLGS